MMVFPQFGASTAQYPIKVTRSYRTVANRCLGGSAWFYGDPTGATLLWELTLNGLTDSEWNSLQAFFEVCEGRLREFTFLDPTANLLSYSEDLTADVWQADPMIQLSVGVSDPLGGDGATGVINAGQSEQALVQTLPVPGSHHYALSLFVRSGSPTTISLQMASASGSQGEQHSVDTGWRRIVLSTSLAVADEEVAFGFSVPSGASVEVFGLQVEAQPGASLYMRSVAGGGVFPSSHFDQDQLVRLTDALDSNSTELRIESAI